MKPENKPDEISKEMFFSKTILVKKDVLEYIKKSSGAVYYRKLMEVFSIGKSQMYALLKQLILEEKIISNRGYYLYYGQQGKKGCEGTLNHTSGVTKPILADNLQLKRSGAKTADTQTPADTHIHKKRK